MTFYGDAEPEDAWHPDDPVPVLVANLCRRCGQLGEPVAAATDAERIHEIALAAGRVARRHRELSDRDEVRLALIVEDLEHVRERFAAEAGDG